MNLLPLETFRKVLGYNPYHFWGLVNSKVPVTNACPSVVLQYAWQNADAIGRSEIAEAIEEAEDKLLQYLNFAIAPRYISKTVPWPQYFDGRQARFAPVNANGKRVGVYLGEGMIQAVGVETLTQIGTAAVTLSDLTGDGLYDTFTTAPLATTVTNESEIAAYFIVADRFDDTGLSDRWRILPVSVSISGGNVVVSGRSWLLIKPLLREGFSDDAQEGLDPDDTANYAAQLVIYQRTTSTNGETVETSQGVLLWDTDPCHGPFCWCGSCSGINYDPASSYSDPAAVGMAVARVGVRDAVLGEMLPAQALRSTSGIWYDQYALYREPDRVTLRVLAGWPLEPNGDVSRRYQTLVARLAAAEMERPISSCDVANRAVSRWQFDVARAAGANDEQYSISPTDLDNPFGTRRGQVLAWKKVRDLRLTRGISF